MSDRADVIRAQQDANAAAKEALLRLTSNDTEGVVTALLAVRLEIRALAILLDTAKGVGT